MKKISVAHVITRLCKGGAQENTFQTVRLANRERFEVDLISGPTRGREGSIEDAIGGAGIAILREPSLVRPIAPVRDWLALRGLTRLFHQNRYDIVHTHTSKAGFVGRLAAKRAGTPIVVHTPHGNIFDGYFHPWLTRAFVAMERHVAPSTDRIIELTEGGIDAYLEQGIGRREQYVSIFSGIDLSPYESAEAHKAETRASLGAGPGDLLVGGVGRLEPIKGFTYFIAAAERIAKDVPQARFILAGQGALEDELKAQAAQAATLGDRFRFLGARGDVPSLMAAMDLLVVPSLNEGMGRVVLEAGAAGTPVVAAAVGGIPEVVEDSKTGILVPAKSPEAIAQAVTALSEERARLEAMGRAAQDVVAPAYGLERMVMRIEALYEELIEEKGLDA